MTVPSPRGLRTLDTRPLLVPAFAVTAALLALNLTLGLVGTGGGGAWWEAFSVNRELNVPTMWNASLLLYASAACLLVAALAQRGRVGWVIAGAVLTVMAFDEILSIHERLRGIGARLNEALPFTLPTYSWVLPGLLAAGVLAAAAVVWVRRLPPHPRRRILAGVGIFFGGAIGVEAVSGWLEQRHGVGRAYVVATTLEEGMEMAGCLVLTGGVLRMLSVREVDGQRSFFCPGQGSRAVPDRRGPVAESPTAQRSP